MTPFFPKPNKEGKYGFIEDLRHLIDTLSKVDSAKRPSLSEMHSAIDPEAIDFLKSAEFKQQLKGDL